MKLTVFSMASAEADAKDRGRSVAKPSFQTCHALLQHQPRSVAQNGEHDFPRLAQVVEPSGELNRFTRVGGILWYPAKKRK